MSVRSITKKENTQATPFGYGLYEFPIEMDGIIYVRQSSDAQVKINIHSYEMQTEKFLQHFRDKGCTGHIEIIADDEALSGTLDIHKRPGMSRMMRMIEDHKQGKNNLGWVAAVHVNRFFRDRWMINPDVFIKACYESNIIVATLKMTYNFRDPSSFSERIFRIEAEEAARHLEWMKLVLGGGKSAASDKGYYDGRYITPGYIVDRTDLQRKKYSIYEPHADIVRWLFRRFLELDGNFPQLCREVEALPFVFPQFEEWVDPKTVSRFSLNRKQGSSRTAEGNYKLFRNGLESILTNPVYIGWWIPLDGGVIERNHEPLVDEVLFTYAHKRVSMYTLDGERQKPARVTRHSRVDALLKKVIKDPDNTPIYARRANRIYECIEQQGRLIAHVKFAVAIQAIDTVFLEKFFERVPTIDPDQFRDWEDKVEQKRKAQEEKEGLIRKSIKSAAARMKHILALLTPEEEDEQQEPLSPAMKNALIKEYKGLEEKIAGFEQELRENTDKEAEDEEILYEIHTLIPRIVELWEHIPFEKRLRFVGAVVRNVVLSRVAPSWFKMEIHWKLPGWETDIAHIRRGWNGTDWSTQEDALLREIYPTGDAGDILKAFPTRSWGGIKQRADKLEIPRVRRGKNSIPVNSPSFVDMSQDDLSYAAANGLALHTKNAQWSN